MEASIKSEDGQLKPAVYNATPEGWRRCQELPMYYSENHLRHQTPSSTLPPPPNRLSGRTSILAIVSPILASWGLLCLISVFITRSIDEEISIDFAQNRKPEDKLSAAESIWSVTKIILLGFVWVMPVYFGMQRLLHHRNRGIRVLQNRLRLLSPPKVEALATALQTETLDSVLTCTTLAFMVVAMWSVFGSYSWDYFGYDVCSHPKEDHHAYLSPEDYRDVWTVFHTAFTAVGWHFQAVTALLRATGNWPTNTMGLHALTMSFSVFSGMMLWIGPCRFILVMWNCLLPLLGAYTTAWYMDHTEALFGVFTEGVDFDLTQAHCELMLYLLVLWTVRWAPVSVFCKTESCQYSAPEELMSTDESETL